ncbi:hypothetical protein PTTG_10580, partial [Puccinia triticina 1-1 BBBD Race 1]
MVKIKPQDKSLGFDGTHIKQFLNDYQRAAKLDGASDFDMAQQIRFFVRGEEVRDILETLDGFDPPNWSLLKPSMLAYWGRVDVSCFTPQDLDSLVQSWNKNINTINDIYETLRLFEEQMKKQVTATVPHSDTDDYMDGESEISEEPSSWKGSTSEVLPSSDPSDPAPEALKDPKLSEFFSSNAFPASCLVRDPMLSVLDLEEEDI